MKRFVLEIGAGRPAAVKGKMQKPSDKVKMAEVLARMVDKNLLDAVSAAGKTLDSYVDSLDHIWAYSDKGDYRLAIEMMHVMCMAMDKDSSIILEEIIMPDLELTEYFLDYFGEYITDGYIIERIIANCEPDEGYLSDDEEHEEEVLHDIHYDEVKEFFKKEGEVDE